MNGGTFHFISEVASTLSTSEKTLQELSKLSGNWRDTSNEALQDLKSIFVVINTEKQTQKIEPLQKHIKFPANVHVSVNQAEERISQDIAEEPLELNSALSNATSSLRFGPSCSLTVQNVEVDQEIGKFPLTQFFNSISTPFREISFSNCRGYTSEIEQILDLSFKSGCTRSISLEKCDVSLDIVELLIKYFRNPHKLAQNCDLQLRLGKCTHRLSMFYLLIFFEDWKNGKRSFELTISNWFLKSQQFYKALEKESRCKWRVERLRGSTKVRIIHNESGFEIYGCTLRNDWLQFSAA
ncbi:hypothetical protein L596_029605 [Steinernema carpocapsae]|uniref:Uncharacterized protein n=1 Tax=Steinernema carpocapsae TaxID=34508 RepID=A0A4U5LV47_STECR|nr:hypothetical protein L596_029605 [Steinernema carpocapsae]